jgi:hypothetical protein
MKTILHPNLLDKKFVFVNMKNLLILPITLCMLFVASCDKEKQNDRRIIGLWKLSKGSATAYNYYGNGGHNTIDISFNGNITFNEDETGTYDGEKQMTNPFPSNFNWNVIGETLEISPTIGYTTTIQIKENQKKYFELSYEKSDSVTSLHRTYLMPLSK